MPRLRHPLEEGLGRKVVVDSSKWLLFSVLPAFLLSLLSVAFQERRGWEAQSSSELSFTECLEFSEWWNYSI